MRSIGRSFPFFRPGTKQLVWERRGSLGGAAEKHRGESEEACGEPRGRRQGRARKEHRGGAGEARRDSGVSINGNPALGLSPPYRGGGFSSWMITWALRPPGPNPARPPEATVGSQARYNLARSWGPGCPWVLAGLACKFCPGTQSTSSNCGLLPKLICLLVPSAPPSAMASQVFGLFG